MSMTNRPIIPSASHRLTNDKAFELITSSLDSHARVLDLGAGRGHLARRVATWFEQRGQKPADFVVAADVSADQFEATEVPFECINLNEALPFHNATFDVIYSIEVTEHLHRPYDFLRECFRALKPGGFLIVSTPNILHLASRLRFFLTGFFELYKPPSTDPANAGRLCGHVMPLHLAYYAYGLRLVGFKDVQYAHDKSKRASLVLWILFYPLIAIMRSRLTREVAAYDAGVFQENRDILGMINSKKFLTSRSLMFVARKPVAREV